MTMRVLSQHNTPGAAMGTGIAHTARAVRVKIAFLCRDAHARHARTRKLRSWLATLVLLSAQTLAPQTLAQCGPPLTLAPDQWAMVGVPCAPDPGANTIGAVFGPSTGLGAANYGITWIMYRRVYDAAGDAYTPVAVTDTVAAGDAFWLYPDDPTTVDFSLVSPPPTATPGIPWTGEPPAFSGFPFAPVLETAANSPRFLLFENPYEDTVTYASFRWTGSFFFIFPFNVDTLEAANGGVVTGTAHYWNGSSYDARAFNDPVDPATFVPKQGAWLEFLSVSPFIFNLTAWVVDPTP
ncbi:MAG: hypothetical protein HRT77_06295 [Halioglobus sp.]|nr:hypothetical protein [Halioglobus sp.]